MVYLKEQEEKHKQEIKERLTAVKHVQAEHFSNHIKVEGYAPNGQMEHSFGCDRLLKLETMFSKVQMGFNPNQGKSFLIMNLKTSRYDTIDSQYQKEIKEEQMKPINRNGFQNRAFASKKKQGAAVLIEKSDTRPWSESTVKTYFGRRNLETLQKAMPFFSRIGEKQNILANRKKGKELQERIQENVNKGMFKKNITLRNEQRGLLYEDNQLHHFIRLKEAESRYFFRKLNFSYDVQKDEMFHYYKNRKSKTQGKETVVNEQPAEDEKKDE